MLGMASSVRLTTVKLGKIPKNCGLAAAILVFCYFRHHRQIDSNNNNKKVNRLVGQCQTQRHSSHIDCHLFSLVIAIVSEIFPKYHFVTVTSETEAVARTRFAADRK